MNLDTYMEANNLTDKSFGQLIGKSRIQIYKYRHGLQAPTRKGMQKILDVTQGKVDPASFYQTGSPQ